MNIEICINTNNYSGKDVQIDLKDIMDFTRNMYAEGNCEAVVKFECMPAAVYPDLIQVVLKKYGPGTSNYRRYSYSQRTFKNNFRVFEKMYWVRERSCA